MKFGQLLKDLRKNRNIEQKHLAALANFSPAMLSQIERGKIIPSEDTAKSFMDALGLDEPTRYKLMQALKKESKVEKDKFLFGNVLNKILMRLCPKPKKPAIEFSERINQSAAVIYMWISGTKLPGDETLVESIIPALVSLGANDEDISKLKRAHLYDVLARALRLEYLSEEEREELLSIVEKSYGKEKSKKRGQGEGSIYKRKDGRWAAAITIGYENGRLRRKTVYGKTRKEVQDKLNEELGRLKKGLPVITERQTVKQFLDRWLADCVKPSVRLSTYLSYESEVRVHISTRLGHIQLEKLTPQHIQAYINDRLKSDLSATTVAYHISLLRMALNQALRWNLVQRNVALLVDKPRTEKYEITPLTQKQAQDFLKAIEGDRLECFFSVALSLGLRRGEALALRWQDIDLDGRSLRVCQTLQRLDGELRVSEPKTKGSKRVLALPDSLVAKLKAHRARQLEERLAAGEHWQDTGLVFTTSLGTALDPRNIKRSLDRLLEDAELPHFRVHDLRHFCASLLLAQGLSLKAISDILGHSRIAVTGDLYAHVLPSLKRDAADVMDSIFTGTH